MGRKSLQLKEIARMRLVGDEIVVTLADDDERGVEAREAMKRSKPKKPAIKSSHRNGG